MAPSSANKNPETRKPARALPLPGARVALVLPAMSIVFDCIISDGGLGKGGDGNTPSTRSRGPGEPGDRRGCQRISGKRRRKSMAVSSVPGGGLSKFVEGSRKREDPGAVACAFSRLRMARGVQRSVYGFWFRGIVSFGELPPVCAICLPRSGHHLPGGGDFFLLFGRLGFSTHDGNLRSIHGSVGAQARPPGHQTG